MTGLLEATPLVSIIIVNWNGSHLLEACISSLLAQTYKNFEVILVDNNSHDNSVAYVNKTYPFVVTKSLESNRGFTGGNIEGYRIAKGDYLVLLNNDACLCERWLELMLNAMESDARIGSCSSKILIEATDLIDSVGDVFTTAFTGTKLGEHQNTNCYNETMYVSGACAAAVIYRRTMLQDVGFLDDDFFLNHEDTDLNMRSWLAGWKCRFVPEAVAYHKVSASIGTLSDTAVYYFTRNNVWVWVKNVPFILMLKYLPHRILYEISLFIFFCIMQKMWRPYIRGKRDALLGVPAMLKKRQQIQRLVRLNTNEIEKSLVSLTSYLLKRVKNVIA